MQPALSKKKQTEPALIFAMDISGSMGCGLGSASHVSAGLGSHARGGRITQRLVEPDGKVNHVSRLQFMRAAVSNLLTELAQRSPQLRVGLISFNDRLAVAAGAEPRSATQVRSQTIPNFLAPAHPQRPSECIHAPEGVPRGAALR